MKKYLFVITMLLVGLTVMANNQKKDNMETIKKGKMEVYDLGNFKLHVYNNNDAMADASFIIEGKKSLVLMELPLFKENAVEFEAYYKALSKPVEKVITNYHLGGTEDVVATMPEGMPQFIKGPIYSGMMQHFATIFGDSMVTIPDNQTEEIPFGSTQKWAGVEFTFSNGASSDFPGASLNIGNKAYYTHWTPAKAHPSNLQISSAAAIDAEIVATENSLKSKCDVFIGGHGGATTRDVVEFRLAYLKTIKQIFNENKTTEAFMKAVEAVYPNIPGDLKTLAETLYK